MDREAALGGRGAIVARREVLPIGAGSSGNQKNGAGNPNGVLGARTAPEGHAGAIFALHRPSRAPPAPPNQNLELTFPT